MEQSPPPPPPNQIVPPLTATELAMVAAALFFPCVTAIPLTTLGLLAIFGIPAWGVIGLSQLKQRGLARRLAGEIGRAGLFWMLAAVVLDAAPISHAVAVAIQTGLLIPYLLAAHIVVQRIEPAEMATPILGTSARFAASLALAADGLQWGAVAAAFIPGSEMTRVVGCFLGARLITLAMLWGSGKARVEIVALATILGLGLPAAIAARVLIGPEWVLVPGAAVVLLVEAVALFRLARGDQAVVDAQLGPAKFRFPAGSGFWDDRRLVWAINGVVIGSLVAAIAGLAHPWPFFIAITGAPFMVLSALAGLIRQRRAA